MLPRSRLTDRLYHSYPEPLADSSWDNTGLLLDAPEGFSGPSSSQPAPISRTVLLTIDLTRAVTAAALARHPAPPAVIVAYHPPIFRPLRALTAADPQQASLLALARAGVAVYSPHSAVDAAPGGMGEWLARAAVERMSGPGGAGSSSDNNNNNDADALTDSEAAAPVQSIVPIHSAAAMGVTAAQLPAGVDLAAAGMGRLVTLTPPGRPLGAICARLARNTGTGTFAVATPQKPQLSVPTSVSTSASASVPLGSPAPDLTLPIRTIALCNGSGAGVLLTRQPDGTKAPAADLLITGEMSHHDALAATERGAAVVSLLHSNSERGFLRAVMRDAVEASVREELGDDDGGNGEKFEVVVSDVDRDPYGHVSFGVV